MLQAHGLLAALLEAFPNARGRTESIDLDSIRPVLIELAPVADESSRVPDVGANGRMPDLSA